MALGERRPVGRALRERVRQAELGAAVGAALTSGEPLRPQLQRCAEALVRHLDAAFARIWTLDEAARVLELEASAGLHTRLDGGHSRVPVGRFKIGRIAEGRQPHLTNQVLGDPEVHDQDWARRERLVAFAGYPLVVGDQLVGVMALFARRPLPASTLRALAAVADGVALGIDRARADAELETVHRLGQRLAAELDLERLVQAVTDAATELSGARFGAFFYNAHDERGEAYTLYTLSGAPREAFARFPLPRNTAVFGPTFRGEGVVRIADVTRDPRYGRNAPHRGLPPGHLPVRSYLAVPVVSRSGEVHGGLFFGHPEPGVFTARAERVVAGLAAQAAVAMDNARLYRQARQAVRMRDHLLATVAHDLNNPLTAIRGQAQLLGRQAARPEGASPERLAAGLGHIERATDRMAAMIKELSDLARLEVGRPLELDRGPTDLVALARRVAAEQHGATGRHTIRVEVGVPELVGAWDAARLERALDNLVGNAVKYSPAGGEVAVAVAREGDGASAWAVLSVADTGLGIPAADLPRIFEPFYRGASVAGQVPGTGLGLAGARQVVEQHGGTIAVASREGQGSTFTVRLPLAPPDARTPA